MILKVGHYWEKFHYLDFNSLGMSQRLIDAIDSWGNTAKTGLHDDVWPCRTILWDIPDR